MNKQKVVFAFRKQIIGPRLWLYKTDIVRLQSTDDNVIRLVFDYLLDRLTWPPTWKIRNGIWSKWNSMYSKMGWSDINQSLLLISKTTVFYHFRTLEDHVATNTYIWYHFILRRNSLYYNIYIFVPLIGINFFTRKVTYSLWKSLSNADLLPIGS